MKNTIAAVIGAFTLCWAVCMGTKPNILFILLDDLGWHDVQWNNALMYQPNLIAMANAGVILSQSYVQSVCTPSRAALLTGKYPHNIGIEDDGVIAMDDSYGLPIVEELLPSKLKTLGYDTHAIGKWHLGFCDIRYTPTYRGFDSFLGFYGSGQEYSTHKGGDSKVRGYDLRMDENVLSSTEYDTDLFTDRAIEIINATTPGTSDPWFIYLAYNAIHSPIKDPPGAAFVDKYSADAGSRRSAAAMSSVADEGIGKIKDILTTKGALDNTLIIFASDNGGASKTDGGMNTPLRGMKKTPWEGGIKTPAFVYNSGTLLNKKAYTNDGMIHITDWTPTLLAIAGYKPTGCEMFDGVNQWDMISNGAASARSEIVHHISQRVPASGNPNGVIRSGDFKLIAGNIGLGYNDWYEDPLVTGIPLSGTLSADKTFNKDSVLLFNIIDDPNEETDIASDNDAIVDLLTQRLATLRSEMVNMTLPLFADTDSNPSNFGGNWSPGWCNADNHTALLTYPV